MQTVRKPPRSCGTQPRPPTSAFTPDPVDNEDFTGEVFETVGTLAACAGRR